MVTVPTLCLPAYNRIRRADSLKSFLPAFLSRNSVVLACGELGTETVI